jgi:hypothetical protein
MSNHTIDQLKAGESTLPPELNDDDLRQLIIHYATIVRNPKGDGHTQVVKAWDSWPKPLFDAFAKIVFDTVKQPGESFWCRPADINIKYGIDKQA